MGRKKKIPVKGGIHDCAMCGNQMFLLDQDIWAYKKRSEKRNGTYMWFCSWKCMRKWEAENPPKRVSMWW